MASLRSLFARADRRPRAALTAAAARLQLKEARPRARKRQAWQERNWEMWEAVPQVRDAFDSHANLVARVGWFAGIRVDPDADPIPLTAALDDPAIGRDVMRAHPWMTPTIALTAIDNVRRVASLNGGQDQIKVEMADNLGVAGEGYLCCYFDDELGVEVWDVYSIDELVFRDGQFHVIAYPGERQGRVLPPETFLARIWHPHSRWTQQPTSRLRSALDDLEEYVRWRQGNHAVAQSRIANAGLLIYDKDKFGKQAIDPARKTVPQALDNPAFSQLAEAMVTAIGNPEDASAVLPVTMGVSGDVSTVIQHIKFDRPIDDKVLDRMAALMLSVAYALPLPVERAGPEGLAGVNHWTGWLVDESGFKTYVEPDVRLQVDAITEAWLQPSLVEEFALSDQQASAIVTWYDPTPILVRPNRVSDVREAFHDGVAGPRVYREAIGLDEDDAPTPEELATYEKFLQAQKAPSGWAAANDSTTETQSPPPAPAAARLPVGPATYDRPALTAGAAPRARRLARMSSTLSSIDRQLLDRLRIASSAALNDALRVAASRAKGAAQGTGHAARLRGVNGLAVFQTLGADVHALSSSVDDLLDGAFDDVTDEFESWTAQAQRRALGAVLGVDDLPEDDANVTALRDRQTERRVAAGAAFAAGLYALARTQIESGAPAAPIAGEWDSTLAVPTGLVRSALSVAGGAAPSTSPVGGMTVTTTLGTTEPAPGIGTGPDLSELIRSALRAEVTGWAWVHDAPPTDFEPHAELDGQEFASWDDPALANVDGGWPGVEFYMPGDHAGCACSFEKLWGEAGEPAGDAEVADE